MSWSFRQNDFHRKGAYRALEVNGTPVVVRSVGSYAEAYHEDGRSTRDVPHVLVSIDNGFVDGVQHWTGVTVEARSPQGNTSKLAQVFKDIDYQRLLSAGDLTPDRWIAVGVSHVEAAIAALAGLDEAYAQANAIVARSLVYRAPLQRNEYEAACAALGSEPLSDAECDSYGVRHGHFAYPEYAADLVVQKHLARLRLHAIDSEKATTGAESVVENPLPFIQKTRPALTGQLWEPCEQCGTEPSYMPLHLCAGCWPEQAGSW